MIDGITLITLGLVLFALGTFILGCLRCIGYAPKHMLQYVDRAAIVRYALRYSRNYSILMLCIVIALIPFCI